MRHIGWVAEIKEDKLKSCTINKNIIWTKDKTKILKDKHTRHYSRLYAKRNDKIIRRRISDEDKALISESIKKY